MIWMPQISWKTVELRKESQITIERCRKKIIKCGLQIERDIRSESRRLENCLRRLDDCIKKGESSESYIAADRKMDGLGRKIKLDRFIQLDSCKYQKVELERKAERGGGQTDREMLSCWLDC